MKSTRTRWKFAHIVCNGVNVTTIATYKQALKSVPVQYQLCRPGHRCLGIVVTTSARVIVYYFVLDAQSLRYITALHTMYADINVYEVVCNTIEKIDRYLVFTVLVKFPKSLNYYFSILYQRVFQLVLTERPPEILFTVSRTLFWRSIVKIWHGRRPEESTATKSLTLFHFPHKWWSLPQASSPKSCQQHLLVFLGEHYLFTLNTTSCLSLKLPCSQSRQP